MGELKLHDIKPLVEVPDNSLLFFSITVVASLIVLALVIWGIYRFVQRKKKTNWQAFYLKALADLDRSDSKVLAYKVTEYGQKLTKSPEQSVAFDVLLENLELYKYKKAVEKLEPKTETMIEEFLKSFEK
ncbi:MAG: FeoB-associated Cys-rich membrane protein [Thiovulaceae bacterium]|nr:FeoB-associated Cys-rich membrane protein [Sulfurimonadaceae bacterium]